MEAQYESVVRGLISSGHSVALVTTSGIANEDALPAYDEIYIASEGVGRYSLSWWWSTWRRRRPWRVREWDVVFSVSFAGGMATFWSEGVPVAGQVHGTAMAEVLSSARMRTPREGAKMLLNSLRVARELVFLSRFDMTIAISNSVREQLHRWPYRRRRKELIVIPNGVRELPEEKLATLRSLYRRKLNLSEADIAFLFSGRLHPQKGVLDAIEAVRNLPAGKLIIAGDGPEGHQVAEAVGSDSRLIVLGRVPQDDLRGIFAAADTLLFPSKRREGMPMTLLEGMAAGLPMIAYEGALAPEDTPRNARLVAQSPSALSLEMRSAQPRSRVVSGLPRQYSEASMTSAYESLLNEMIGGRDVAR